MEQRKRILVVDDEASSRELLQARLTELGHEVDMAADGVEALAKLDGSHDLVLLDLMMPGINGFDVARRIRSESSVPDIPICMITIFSGKEEQLLAVEAGVNDFIAKPLDKTELQVRTASLLKWKAAQDAIKNYQRELQEQHNLLLENHEQLHLLHEQKDEFLRIASHDLRTPLASILQTTSTIALTPPERLLAAKTKAWAERIAAQCHVMQKIIEDFLDFQALEDGQIKLTPAAVDFNKLAAAVLERNAGYAEMKGITPHLDLEQGALLMNADQSRLDQVLENIIGNAIKFSPPGEQVTVCARKTASGIHVEVRDSGPGFTEEDLEKLFIKYAKLSNKPTGGERSSGLGLAICKKLIEIHGGEIGARNNAERGATLWFDLPNVMPVSPPAPSFG